MISDEILKIDILLCKNVMRYLLTVIQGLMS